MLALVLLLGCGSKDSGSDSDPGVAPYSCDAPTSGFAIPSGTYVTSIDSELFNNCENEAGKGLHIHVGQDTPMALTVTDGCMTGESSGMPLEGFYDGQQMTLEGFLEQEIGTCTVGITAVMSATLTADGTFDYEMSAVADVYYEVVEGACDLIIGETENHTYPALPCDQAWVGQGWPQE